MHVPTLLLINHARSYSRQQQQTMQNAVVIEMKIDLTTVMRPSPMIFCSHYSGEGFSDDMANSFFSIAMVVYQFATSATSVEHNKCHEAN
ncbi:hypothetical protein FOZ60_008065 [Perkinsus olseni]|uniref:Uncharacterized protein n=1 Tax=Perkinsus olseni TaxID=32597 RepID=A0A7J6PE62_PEROL|nr:hypothetical protein FOZ60_008065 [Perkinsus olseni]